MMMHTTHPNLSIQTILYMPILLLLPLLLTFPIITVNGIIYLEDPIGALHYDALPDPPPFHTIEEDAGWEEVLYNNIMKWEDDPLFKLGTPDHYLLLEDDHGEGTINNISIVMPTGSPSFMGTQDGLSSTMSPSSEDVLASIISPTSISANDNNNDELSGIINETNITNTTIQNNNNDNNNNNNTSSSSSIFDRRGRLLNNDINLTTQQETAEFDANKKYPPTSSPSTTIQQRTIQPSTTSSPTSVIHEITGEYTHNIHPDYDELDNNDNNLYEEMYNKLFGYFDDMKLLGLTPPPEPDEGGEGKPMKPSKVVSESDDGPTLQNDNDSEDDEIKEEESDKEENGKKEEQEQEHPNNIVYYDTKQARFGIDLGPLGNAVFVNIMLPPIYYGKYWEQTVGGGGGKEGNDNDGSIVWEDIGNVVFDEDGDDDDDDKEENSKNETIVHGVNQTNTGENGTLEGSNVSNGDASNNVTNDIVNSTNENAPFIPSLDIDIALSTIPENQNSNDQGTNDNSTSRRLEEEEETVDELLLGLLDTTENSSSINVEGSNIFDAAVVSTEGKGEKNMTTNIIDENSNNQGNAEVTNENVTIVGSDSTTDNSTTGQSQNIGTPIANYFCLEDFVNWRIQQRNNTSSKEDHKDETPMLSHMVKSTTANVTNSSLDQIVSNWTTTNNTDSLPKMVETTRPLTILAQRGRCSFESKARMAMVLNDLFKNSGRNNSIENIIIYNNGTDDDNNTQNGEVLVDMSLVSAVNSDGSPVDETGGITVGLLYITSKSGEDIIRRIKEREGETHVNPYVDVSMLFSEDFSSDEQSRHQRKQPTGMVDEANMDDGEHDNTIGQDDESNGVYDDQVSHGWWFPATLTRFCLSCGEENQYGMVWPSEQSKPPPPGFPDQYPPFPPLGPCDNGRCDGSYPGLSPGYTIDYYSRPWLEVIRKLMVTILVLLLVGPVLLAARRWYTVGGTVRLTTDENGNRRLRMISPNLEVFVNGIADTVETNGTKLDRAQVFALPEIEYAGVTDEENRTEYNNVDNNDVEAGGSESGIEGRGDEHTEDVEEDTPLASAESTLPSLPTPVTPPRESESSSGQFVSSHECSICLDEFAHGEKLRLLPRCNHAFHTECILPWLTERQGCCPLCKTPVLPDELQRNSRRRRTYELQRQNSRRRQRTRSSRSGDRQHPFASIFSEQSTEEREEESSGRPIITGVGLVAETESDLDAAPQAQERAVTPDRSPLETSLLGDDLINLEQGQTTTPIVLDMEDQNINGSALENLIEDVVNVDDVGII